MSVWERVNGWQWRYGAYTVIRSERSEGWWVMHNGHAEELLPTLETAKAWTKQYAAAVELATKAKTDRVVAKGALRRLAAKHGYAGTVGGWIYRGSNPTPIAHGWQQFADLVAAGRIRLVKVEA